MFKKFIIKNWIKLFRVQVIVFAAFSMLTILYYYDKPAHQYFNRNMEEITLQSTFSLLMTYLFIAFILVLVVFPFFYISQIVSLRQNQEIFRKNKTKLSILIVLYLLTIISTLSLLTIHNSHSIEKIN